MHWLQHRRTQVREDERVNYSRGALLFAILALTACSQRFAVSINERPVFDPRPGASAYRFADSGLQACVNFALQQPGASFDTLTILACPDWEIENIEGIGSIATLQYLDISNNRLTSLAPLSALTRLSGLNAAANQLTDIAPLLSIRTLTSVVLAGNDGILCRQLEALEQRLQGNLTRPADCSG